MKKFIIGVLLVVLVAAGLYFGKDYLKINTTTKSNNPGYSDISYKKIKDLGLELYFNNTYYKTLDKVMETDKYINDYLQSYIKINYVDSTFFIEGINELLENNYVPEEINKISFIFESKYYKKDYLKRYISYYENNPKIDKNLIVTYVNIGLDNDFYTNIKEVENPNDILVLVNKYNKLPEAYYPKDTIKLSSKYLVTDNKNELRAVAGNALMSMIDAINKENMNLWMISGLRTKSYQNMLFTNSTKKNGIEHALIYSAKPRHSEHETGLAADISSVKGMLNGFEDYKEYTWLKENAYKYGFIERYPKGKENITGYAYESWHWRYVGVEVATIIKNEDITFEEYAVKYMNY